MDQLEAIDRLADEMIDNISFDLLDTREVIRYNPPARQVIINVSSASFQKIFQNYAHSPYLLYYLISSIYSAINYELEEVTDEDEMKFQARLMENFLPL